MGEKNSPIAHHVSNISHVMCVYTLIAGSLTRKENTHTRTTHHPSHFLISFFYAYKIFSVVVCKFNDRQYGHVVFQYRTSNPFVEDT